MADDVELQVGDRVEVYGVPGVVERVAGAIVAVRTENGTLTLIAASSRWLVISG